MTDVQTSELHRRDLMELEPLLRDSLHAILPFNAHALYFPQEDTLEGAEWLPRERKILLPLRRSGQLLGVFMMSGVTGRQARPLLAVLPNIATLALDKLAWFKASRLEPVTGLLYGRVLLERLSREADLVRARMHGLPDGDDTSTLSSRHAAQQPDQTRSDLHRLCMGLITLQCDNIAHIIRDQGHAFADKILHALGRALLQDLPADVSAARSGSYEFTLLLPSSGRTICHRVAEAALQRMANVSLHNAVTHRPVWARVTGGYAVYPQDMQGVELSLPMFEQSRILLDRARLAAHIAAEKLQATVQNTMALPLMDFAHILHVGGVIRENLPMGRVRVSLGRQAGASEGMHFTVWQGSQTLHDGQEAAPSYKGELVLLDVQENFSTAETSHLSDPAWPLERGDSLVLLRDADAHHSVAPPPRTDPLTGLLRHADFLHLLSEEREKHASFSLALVRITPQEGADLSAAQVEQLLPKVVCHHSQLIQKFTMVPPLLSGRYGSHCVIFFHTNTSTEALQQLYTALAECMQAHQLTLATGLALYPFLQFSKAEMLTCALKALNCALLLPAPHISTCDSLALNVSADHQYSLGDTFGAVEEYKLALLADDNNATAWNSLGVCMAAMGQTEHARRYFLEAQKRAPQDAAVAYNMGTLCQSLHDYRAASKHFKRCIKLAPGHLYAHIRLGQLAEQHGRRKMAQHYYQQAALLEATEPESCIAQRHLARIALKQKRGAEARELLHDALLKNPQDAAAMRMLASLYLDGNEDPAMAEMLARKSVCLQPSPQGWQLLARALHALGREKDALRAERMVGTSH